MRIIEVVASWLKNGVTGDSKNNPPGRINDIHKAVAARLEDEDESVRWVASKALDHRSDLSDEILKHMVVLLNHEHWWIRQSAAGLLGSQLNTFDGALNAVAALLKDEKGSVRSVAVRALCGQSDLPDDIFKIIVALLEGEEEGVRKVTEDTLSGVVERALIGQQALSDENLKALATNSRIRERVIGALTSRTDLSGRTFTAIAAYLKHKSGSVVEKVLGNLSGASDKIFRAVVSQSESEDASRTIRQAI
ncbi:armadillo-type protein [Xylogone sp. PMI_703]|nr:armadillo-type protein [Xylogone sp. PMI_703]